MSDIAVRAKGLGKLYRIGPREPYYTLRDALMDAAKVPFGFLNRRNGSKTGEGDTIWALKDVSFEIKQGEIVGIIGRNGAGKSTLLKILSRITEPTEGYAEVYGRVGSLLEIGTGFHPELTGRENIYLNGAILGMKRREIDRKFDEIVAFAELEKFIDTPVKRYSSGMYTRLAFSVAAHLEAEILLMDEVLAVGDVAFQSKCLGKMREVSKDKRTVLFVSHNMSAVNSLCNRAMVFRDGFLVADRDVEAAIQAYLMNPGGNRVSEGEMFFLDRGSSGSPFLLQAVRTLDQSGRVRSEFTNLEPIIVEFEFFLRMRVPHLMIGFELKTVFETTVFRSFHNDVAEGLTYRPDPAFRYRLRSVIPPGLLNGGRYYIDACVGIHRRTWLVKDLRALSIQLVFDVPNPDYVYEEARPGSVSPILDWFEGEGSS